VARFLCCLAVSVGLVPAAFAADVGRLSWYGAELAGRRTASGEVFDPEAMTMAHRTLPFGTQVRVVHRGSGRSVVLRVNDRGPFRTDRIADVSRAAARMLGTARRGVFDARLEVLESPSR
jgi:rare lipoprotein A